MQKIYIMHIVQHWRDNMSKILVITPIYKIDGRKELMKDSEAVHYLPDITILVTMCQLR